MEAKLKSHCRSPSDPGVPNVAPAANDGNSSFLIVNAFYCLFQCRKGGRKLQIYVQLSIDIM